MIRPKMKKKGSAAWLIILLCAIIFILYTLWGYSWHLRKSKDSQEQIKDLQNKIEQMKTLTNNEKIFPSIQPISSPSASILYQNQPKIESTDSGKINKEE